MTRIHRAMFARRPGGFTLHNDKTDDNLSMDLVGVYYIALMHTITLYASLPAHFFV